MLDTEKIRALFDATSAAIAIRSPTVSERANILSLCQEVAQQQGLKPYCWDLASGLQEVVLTQSWGQTAIAKNPVVGYRVEGHPVASLLNFINSSKDTALFVVSDLHHFLSGSGYNPAIVRSLIDTCFNLKLSAKRLIILGDATDLPREFEGLVVELDDRLPGSSEIEAAVDARISQLAISAARAGFQLPLELEPSSKQRLVRSLQGLTLEEVDSAIALAVRLHRRIDSQTVLDISARKTQKLKKLGADLVKTQNVRVGGLSDLQAWAQAQASLLDPEARKYGLPFPKGLLLVGYGGTGKSMFAKSLGASWGVEIVSLDLGKMMTSALGASEANLRAILKSADAMSPCILLIDEFDKAFAGMTGAVGDSGTFQRMVASFLQWFEDKTSAAFVVATANRADNFTPELLRRFSAIFYVDLPNYAARVEIWRDRLKQYQIHLEAEYVEMLAAASERFTPAEIDRIACECAVNAYASGKPAQVSLDELLVQVRSHSPSALQHLDEIDKLRRWATSGGARLAALPTGTGRQHDGAGSESKWL